MDERDTRPGFTMGDPLPAGATEPVDVVQVRVDDALIAALGNGGGSRIDDPIDERLAVLLRAWRDDVRDGDLEDAERARHPLVDIGTATAALAAAPRPRPRAQSPFGPWATAAAVLVIAFVGLGLAAKGAQPGDALWNVTKMLYSEKAKSVEAAVTVNRKLDQASAALHSGKPQEAEAALKEAQAKLPVIAVEDGQQQLASRTAQLYAELVGTVPSTTSPPTATNTPIIQSSTPAAVSSTTVVPSGPAPPPSVEGTPLPSDTSTTPTTSVGAPGAGVGGGTGGGTSGSPPAGSPAASPAASPGNEPKPPVG